MMTRTQWDVANDLDVLACKAGVLKSAIETWSKDSGDPTALGGGAYLVGDISIELERLSKEVMNFHREKKREDKEKAKFESDFKMHCIMQDLERSFAERHHAKTEQAPRENAE